jgi:hypothetical protein
MMAPRNYGDATDRAVQNKRGEISMAIVQSRRRFLTNAAFAGAAGFGGFGAWGKALAAEPPPEITTIRFEKDPAPCIAPQVFQRIAARRGL